MALNAPPRLPPDLPRPGAANGDSMAVPLAALRGPRPRRHLGTRRQRVVAALIVVGCLGFLLFRGLTNAMDYYLTANQAVAQRAQLGGNDFRIQGTVLPGAHQVGRLLSFSITSHNVYVHVMSTGVPSQLFKPGMPVVLDGHWQGKVFSSFQIMVQHGSSYVEAHPAKAKRVAGAGGRGVAGGVKAQGERGVAAGASRARGR
ncbi:MAG: cytochrome c maturation protein CcmE [Acidimicrobiales bacterium]